MCRLLSVSRLLSQRDTLASMGAPAGLVDILRCKYTPRAAAMSAARALHNLSIHGGPRSAVVAAGGAAALTARLRARGGESAEDDEVFVVALGCLASGGASRAHREAVVNASGFEVLCAALTRHSHRSESVLVHGTQALNGIVQLVPCEKAVAVGAVDALAHALTSPLLDDGSSTAVYLCAAVRTIAEAPSETRDPSSGAYLAARDALADKRCLAGLVGVLRRATRGTDSHKGAKEALAAVAKGSPERHAAIVEAGGGAALDAESAPPKPPREAAAPPRRKAADVDRERSGE